MTRILDLHKEWMQDEEYCREYDTLEAEFAALRMRIDVSPHDVALAPDQAEPESIPRTPS